MSIYDENSKEREGARLFKPGDIVYVRPDIEKSERWPYVCEFMTDFAGRKVTIAKKGVVYHIEEDGGDYVWTDWMLLSEGEMKEEDGDKSDLLNLL